VTPYWSDGDVSLYLGDCMEVLAEMPGASVDAVVTDPPYGLEFMGREWDSFKPSGARLRTRADARTNPAVGASVVTTPESYIAGQPFQSWCEAWAAECLRVLKPGGHLLAFGGTRTYHRLACGIEDAGFEVRDSMHWIYGSGFPKSLDVSKAIDKAAGAEREVIGRRTDRAATPTQAWPVKFFAGDHSGEYDASAITAPATDDAARWEGWGTALKPAHEPVIVARKPLAGTVAGNVQEHGTGALNIDGCRVAGPKPTPFGSPRKSAGGIMNGTGEPREQSEAHAAGRWPPNVLLGPDAAAELDRQRSGTRAAKPSRTGGAGRASGNGIYASGEGLPRDYECISRDDSGGASRFFPVFRYEAKAASSERPRGGDGTAHPTVKPVSLMAWLIRLVTPPGGTVLDPFAGSGTTAEAAVVERRRCILIERDPAYAGLIMTRMRRPMQPGMFDLEDGAR